MRAQRDGRLAVMIRAAHEKSRRTYGSPRVHAELHAQGVAISRKHVARLMRLECLRARVRKRYRCTTMSDHDQPVAANLLDRRFEAERPNQRWVGDVTEILTGGGKLYLAVILDLFSRMVVGWALSASTTGTWRCALSSRRCGAAARRPGSCITPIRAARTRVRTTSACSPRMPSPGSMSRRGNAHDNAAMESWFSTMTFEVGDRFETHAEAKAKLFDYNEVFYNQERRHSTLGYLSPAQFERAARME
jgi:transposase InsO family protein